MTFIFMIIIHFDVVSHKMTTLLNYKLRVEVTCGYVLFRVGALNSIRWSKYLFFAICIETIFLHELRLENCGPD